MAEARLAERGVTRREAEVLAALGERLTNAEIAARLYLSERTVESHVSSLLRKLGARNRIELAASAAAAPAAASPARLPAALERLADPATYVGRRAELATLQQLWDRASAGELLVGVVAGEAGIGKSRLVAELAAGVHAGGGRVLLGSCFEDSQTPYEPFVQAITDDLATLADDEVARRARRTPAALARVVPSLAGLGRRRHDEILDPLSAQAEVFAGFHAYLTSVAEQAPVLFVVEDIHSGTPTTRHALRHLARAGGRAPVFVVATTRDTPPDLDEERAVFLAGLARLPNVERLDLVGLAEDDVAALLQHLGGDADARAVLAETGGNPLFVREVAGGLGRAGGSLRALLAQRYALLSDADSAVVDVAAVLGAQFDADLVAAAAGQPLGEVLESLERAEAAGLVLPAPGRVGWFSFTHALFRTARYEAIPARARLALHGRAVAALERRGADDRLLPELARHARIAAPLGDPRAALDHVVRAAEAAETALAVGEAADHWRQALEVADLLDPPDPGARLRLSIRLGEAMQGAGTPGWRSVLLDAAATARSMGDAAALVDLGLAMIRYGGPSNPGAADHEFAAIMQEALRELGPEPSSGRARALAAVSEDLCFTDADGAAAMAEEARRIALALDDAVTLGHVLLSYSLSGRTPQNPEARHPTADALIAVGHETGQRAFTILGLAHRAWSLREEGALTAGDAAMDAAVALQGDRAMPVSHVVATTLYRASRALASGDLVEAERLAEGVWAVSGEGFDPTNWYGPAILMIRDAEGRLPELVPMIEVAADQIAIGPAYRAALALAYAEADRPEDARTIVRGFAADGYRAIPPNFMWLATMAALGLAVEWVGSEAEATSLGELLEPFAGRVADLPQGMIAHVDLVLGGLALAAGRPAAAEPILERAAAGSRAHGAWVFLGRELVRLAAARRALGRPAIDVDVLVEEALAIADRTGAHLIRGEAERYDLLGS